MLCTRCSILIVLSLAGAGPLWPRQMAALAQSELAIYTVKALPLEAAVKSHWPSAACRAPIFKQKVEPAVPGTNRRRGG